MWRQLKTVGRHSLVYGLGNAATAALGFVLLPLYAHKLTPAEFGVYAVLTMTLSGLGLIVDGGLTSSVARYYFDSEGGHGLEDHQRRVLSTGILLGLALGAIVALPTLLAAAPLSSHLLGAEEAGLFRLVASILLVRSLTTVPMVSLRLTERATAYVALVILQMATFITFNLLFLVGFEWGVRGILVAQLAATITWALAAFLATRRDLGPWFEWRLARRLLRFGLPFVPVLVFMWVIDASDRYVLGFFVSDAELGLYAFGSRIAQAMAFMVTAFTLGWGPLSFRILTESHPQVIYARVATLYLAGAGLAWLAVSLFASDLVRLFAPPAFASAATYVAPIAFGHLLYGTFALAATGLGAAKRTSAIPLVGAAAAAANVGLNFWLVPSFGAMAAAYTTVAAYVILTAGCLAVSQRYYPIPFEFRRWFVLLGGAGALVFLGGSFQPASWPLGVLVRIVALAAGAALVLLSGALHPEEIAAVRRRLMLRFLSAPRA